MPFEPGYIEPAAPPLDPDGDLLLDESLTGLANQLRREAGDLAERFPAARTDSRTMVVRQDAVDGPATAAVSDLPSPKAAVSGRSPHHVTWLGLAAIGLLSAAGAILSLVPIWNLPVADIGPPQRSSAESFAAPDSARVVEAGGKKLAVDQPTNSLLDHPRPRRIVPGGLTPTYSGPQWEGVLDLMEAEQTDEPSVAI